jgi:hypothetical protein
VSHHAKTLAGILMESTLWVGHLVSTHQQGEVAS